MFKNIDLLVKHGISFALYRLPNQQKPILIVGKEAETKSVASIIELNDMSGFVVAPFKPTAHTPIVCIQPERIIKGYENIAAYLQELSFPDNETEDINKEPVKFKDYYPAYKKAFDTFIEVLLTRRFQKLVLSRPFECENTNKVSLAYILKKALDAYPTSFVYLCSTPQTGVWLGSSPELLLEGQGDKWKTVALAGTQSVEDTLTNYSWDNKNRYEQQLVTDYIKQLLDSLKLQYVQDDSHTVKIGRLIHLKTGFSFQLNGSISIGELLDKLHPTPAICGLPKTEAYDFIVKNEGYDRSYYSGFVGYLDRERQTNLYVNLRCMKVEPEYFRLYAGGGLLPTSELNLEWEETNAKLQTMLSLLK